MKLLPKSEISFELTKDELIETKRRPKREYNWWLTMKKTQQVIDNLLSRKKFIKLKNQ